MEVLVVIISQNDSWWYHNDIYVSIMGNLFTLFQSKVIHEDPVVDGEVWPDELEEEKVRRPMPTTRKT